MNDERGDHLLPERDRVCDSRPGADFAARQLKAARRDELLIYTQKSLIWLANILAILEACLHYQAQVVHHQVYIPPEFVLTIIGAVYGGTAVDWLRRRLQR